MPTTTVPQARVLTVLLLLAATVLLSPGRAGAASTGDPDDRQWHLADVQVPLAWQRARGEDVVVAALDTGITPGPDLACRRFVAEYDATTGRTGPVEDATGHGTHVAGTIGQCSGNGLRTAGVAPEVVLMDVKVLSSSPSSGPFGSSSAVADGIRHAAQNGADVINLAVAAACSQQEPTHAQGCRFPDIDAAIAFADSMGVVMLAAAGNDGTGRVSYPANHPEVIAVGATDASLQAADYSNAGSAIDHVAPGGVLRDSDGDGVTDGIYQEWYDVDVGRHRTLGLTGTSHAVAHSSGVVALLLSARPDLSPDEVRALLNGTACDLAADGEDPGTGAGLVRGANALEAAVTGVGRGVCFLDVEPGDTFFAPVSEFAQRELTRGCNDVGNLYCPDRLLTRGEMAAFLDRALDLPATDRDAFVDDERSIFEDSINRLAAAGITDGCNPPVNNRYCPDDLISRGQMAKFLDRSFDPPRASRDWFVDDGTSIYEASIDRIREDRITLGCNPPANSRFCPTDPVTREQMAAFVVRALQ